MSINFDVDVKINPLLQEILNKAVVDGLTKSILVVDKQAKRNCPVEFGVMVNSIEFQVDENDLKASESVNTEYAVYVEYADGTVFKKKSPRGKGTIPFLRPALYDNRDKIVTIMNNEIKKAIK